MNTEQFWQLIEATQASTQDEQLGLFARELLQLAPQELIEFERLFVEHSFAAYSWDLWLVPWLCTGGMCTDDDFLDFRSWLISRGRSAYEAALNDADALADEMRQADYPQFEDFGYAPSKAYRAITGGEFPDFHFEHPKEPVGGDWMRAPLKDTSDSELLNRCIVFDRLGCDEFAVIEQRFPKIWALCVERGTIRTPETKPESAQRSFPTPEEIAETVDPNLAKTDFAAYLKATGDALQKAYTRKE